MTLIPVSFANLKFPIFPFFHLDPLTPRLRVNSRKYSDFFFKNSNMISCSTQEKVASAIYLKAIRRMSNSSYTDSTLLSSSCFRGRVRVNSFFTTIAYLMNSTLSKRLPDADDYFWT